MLIPGDHLKDTKGNIYVIEAKETYYCHGCKCKFDSYCKEFYQKSNLILKCIQNNQQHLMTHLYVLEKLISKELSEGHFQSGIWKEFQSKSYVNGRMTSYSSMESQITDPEIDH